MTGQLMLDVDPIGPPIEGGACEVGVDTVRVGDGLYYQAVCSCGQRGWRLDVRQPGAWQAANEEGSRHEAL